MSGGSKNRWSRRTGRYRFAIPDYLKRQSTYTKDMPEHASQFCNSPCLNSKVPITTLEWPGYNGRVPTTTFSRRAIGRGGLWLPLPGGRVGALEDSGRTG
jgi:hypothetical protein